MKAFIYSLDAFISLMIIAMALNMLVFGLGLSTYQYAAAYQLKLLSSDGIKALAASPYLDNIVNNIDRAAACEIIIRDNLPPGYGYELLAYDKDSGKWSEIKDCFEGSSSNAGIGVQSSDAIVTVSTHTIVAGMKEGTYDPYDYITCRGGKGVPCNLQNYTPEWGLNSTIMRLVVFI
jgi:hypothetical protein